MTYSPDLRGGQSGPRIAVRTLKMRSINDWEVEIPERDFIRVVSFTGPDAERQAREFARSNQPCPHKP